MGEAVLMAHAEPARGHWMHTEQYRYRTPSSPQSQRHCKREGQRGFGQLKESRDVM